jgi:uncharacterized RDD family membrane protein YckC
MEKIQEPTEYERASFAQRFFARFIDVWLVGAVLMAVSSGDERLFQAPFRDAEWNWAFREFLTLGILLLSFAYYLFADGLFSGQGLGKALMGIRVVDMRSRQPCTVGQAGLRMVIQLIPLIAVIETVVLAIDGVQRYGDRIAQTYVVRVHPKPEPVAMQPAPPLDIARLKQTMEKLKKPDERS